MSGLPKEVIDQLQKEYIATFDEKSKDLDVAYKNFDVKQLQTLFHKLAGSGTTYEMEEISIIGRAAEQYIIKNNVPVKEFINEAILALKFIFKSRSKGKAVDVNKLPIMTKLSGKVPSTGPSGASAA